MNYSKYVLGVVGVVAIALCSQPVLAVTVPDGSFETLDTGGYFIYDPVEDDVTFTNNAGVASSTFSNASPPDGSQYAFIQSGGGSTQDQPGSIAFAISGLSIGTSYTVTFYGSQRDTPYPVNPLDVTFGGADLGTFSPSSSTSFAFFRTASFVATSGFGDLIFTGTETTGDSDSALDDVKIVPTASLTGAVPEPSTWMMTIAGFGLIGNALRRRPSLSSALS